MNVINMLVNFQNDKFHIKREIMDQKVKVKKKRFLINLKRKLCPVNSNHTSFDRKRSELLGDASNIYVPHLGPDAHHSCLSLNKGF